MCFILQVPLASKLKYASEMIRQVYIFDTKAVDPTFQEAYLANYLVNIQRLSDLFYKIDLLLEYQNSEFK